jgi:hypothetical protein
LELKSTEIPILTQILRLSYHFSDEHHSSGMSAADIHNLIPGLIGKGMPYDSFAAAKQWCVNTLVQSFASMSLIAVLPWMKPVQRVELLIDDGMPYLDISAAREWISNRTVTVSFSNRCPQLRVSQCVDLPAVSIFSPSVSRTLDRWY